MDLLPHARSGLILTLALLSAAALDAHAMRVIARPTIPRTWPGRGAFGPVDAKWGTAIQNYLRDARTLGIGLTPVLSKLADADLSQPDARAALAPIVWSLETQEITHDRRVSLDEAMRDEFVFAAQFASDRVADRARHLLSLARRPQQDPGALRELKDGLEELTLSFGIYIPHELKVECAVAYHATRKKLQVLETELAEADVRLVRSGLDSAAGLEAAPDPVPAMDPAGEEPPDGRVALAKARLTLLWNTRGAPGADVLTEIVALARRDPRPEILTQAASDLGEMLEEAKDDPVPAETILEALEIVGTLRDYPEVQRMVLAAVMDHARRSLDLWPALHAAERVLLKARDKALLGYGVALLLDEIQYPQRSDYKEHILNLVEQAAQPVGGLQNLRIPPLPDRAAPPVVPPPPPRKRGVGERLWSAARKFTKDLTAVTIGGAVGGVAMFVFGGWVTLAGVAWAWKWAYYDDEPTVELPPAEAVAVLPAAGAPALPPATETIEDPDEDPDD